MKRLIENIKAMLNGRKDGKSNLPSKYEEKSPYLKKIMEEGNSTINSVNGQWLKADESLKSEWLKSTGREIDSEKKLKESENSYKEASSEYLKHNPEEDGIPKKLSKKFRFYYFLLPFFVTADIYLTVIVFRIFGESDFINILFGGILGIVMALFCHKLGEKLASSGKKYDRIFLITGVSMIITVCLAFGILRGIYISNSNVSGFSFILFSVLNLFFIFSAIFYSYKVHKPGILKLKEAEVNLAKADRTYNNSVRRRLDTVTMREKRHRIFLSKAERIINRVNHLMHIYWQKNIRKRSKQIEGEYNPKTIVLNIPPSLVRPEWETKFFTNLKNETNEENYNGFKKNQYENAHNINDNGIAS
ncbi:MAG: hypothetical protein IPN57_07985 [Ignavibacteria bacterium]|nr:hypothetical protein [Ignavibacteria bacterium]